VGPVQRAGSSWASSEVKKASPRREVVPGKQNGELYSLWLVG
jgi:hypothetical protein